MIRKNLFLLLALVFFGHNLLAVEGMWLPILLKKYNMEEMQAKGFKLTEQDIYDINQASLKDAVVGLIRVNRPGHHFCTGELISGQGLLLTNHHCGYGAIQSHSSVENDYLTDGFWAMSKDEELSNPGLGVSFLRRIEDVSSRVLDQIPAEADSYTRDSLIAVAIADIEKEAEEDGRFSARVKPFFSGNEYYLSVYQIYRDVRLVGAPPSAIGKFGGDTDNWMWPRHTGDFSLFRIYADKDNNPADYSEDNVPYTPVKFFEISTAGVQKGDFTMVMGYPGTTQEYLPSFAIDQQMNVINPARIKIRTKGLQIMKAAQESDPAIRIKYASKVAGMANGWKKWIGENKGLARLNAIEKKQQQEAAFTAWVNQSTERQKTYGHLLKEYEKNYTESTEAEKVATYFSETLLGHENVRFVSGFRKLNEITKTTGTEELEKIKSELNAESERFFKDYDLETGKKVFAAFVEFF
ncbi:MAG: S46 family peptidase [Salinivirgaceae bacterium]